MSDINNPAENFGELREQLAFCQSELGGAIAQLQTTVTQLEQMNDPNLGKVAGMLEKLTGVLTSIKPVISDIAHVGDDELMEAHPEALDRVNGVFQKLEELKSKL